MKKWIFMFAVLVVIMLCGCDISYTKTDREYYRTHTGTETSTIFPTLDELLATGKRTSEKDANLEDGNIIGCDVRTGVATDAYADPSASDVVVNIPADMQFQIMEAENSYFKVTYDKTEVWIPIKNCLVNVKQYIPSLMIDLGLAHAPNYFNIGGCPISGLTEKNLYKRQGALEGQEAWLRYEVAGKLCKAQAMVLEDGYCIKLADAYRPHSVTIAIRDGLNAFLNTTEGIELKQKHFGGYSVGAFLAQQASAHNYGVAVDMTLVEKASGEELSMPSKMHTLDASSAANAWEGKGTTEAIHAGYMQEKMLDCGFSSLNTEWWHFQVDSVDRVMFDIQN